MTEPQTREINQDDILALIACAYDYGHANGVCLGALIEWASPISEGDIARYISSLVEKDGFTDDDRLDLERMLRLALKVHG